MPLYEYICQDCHRHVEKIQSFSAPPLTECPHCGGRLERALSAPAVQFKGSGWYVSDYGKGGGKKPASDSAAPGKADVSAAAATESSGSKSESVQPAKTESTPATSSKTEK